MNLVNQDNVAYLIKNNYLIQIWSDVSNKREEQINRMISYYQNKLQAKPYQAIQYPSDSIPTTIQTEEPLD